VDTFRLLAGVGAGSELIVDAHVVAAAVEGGGGVLLTGDRDDLERIAAPYPGVQVVSVD
jgi:predicted nucleic acid-binding protein